jgi:hypothetical protein
LTDFAENIISFGEIKTMSNAFADHKAKTTTSKNTQDKQQPKQTAALVKPQQSQLFAMVETDSAAAKKDMQRLGQYGEARTQGLCNAFDQIIDGSNEAIADHIKARYESDTDFFDPSAFLDFSQFTGSVLSEGQAIEVPAITAEVLV